MACDAPWRGRRDDPWERVHVEHAGVDDLSLLERSTYGAVQPVLEVELVGPPHHVAEEVAEDRRVRDEQGLEVEGASWW